MSIDYDGDVGIIDMIDSIVVHINDDGEVESVEGASFPVNGQGDPYRFGVKCKNQHGNTVLVITDIDYQTLVVD